MNEYVMYVARNILTEFLKQECPSEALEMWLGQIGNDTDLGRLHNASKKLSDLCRQEIQRRRREK